MAALRAFNGARALAGALPLLAAPSPFAGVGSGGGGAWLGRVVESEEENRARLVEATGWRSRLLEEHAGQAELVEARRPSEWRPVRNMLSVFV